MRLYHLRPGILHNPGRTLVRTPSSPVSGIDAFLLGLRHQTLDDFLVAGRGVPFRTGVVDQIEN